ncbi:MAG TPA: TolC family protein, partial [Pseudomonadota bacterium]|nr:TolC family protein [Pseudomonadota bacterium]
MNTRAWLCTGALSMLLTAPVMATEPSADTAPTVSSLSGPPLPLVEAIQTALVHNPSAEVARQTRLSSEAKVGTARSPWLPQLSLSG